MKKTILFGFVAAFASSVVYAAPPPPDKQHPKPKSDHRHVEVTAMQTTPDAWDAYAYAAFTYWHGQLYGLQYATIGNSTTSQEALFSNPKTRPGFLVGGGILLPKTGVKVNSQYTWYYNKKNRGQGNIRSTTLTGTDEYADGWQTAGGTFASTFNRVDFTLNKEFLFNKYFALIPGGGFIGNWAKFWADAAYSGNTGGAGTVTVSNREKVWGAGPYAKLVSNFIVPTDLIADWSQFLLFIQGGIGFNWQEAKPKYVTTSTFATVDSFQAHFTSNYMTTLIDASVGFRWEMIGVDYNYAKFAVELSWMIQEWLAYSQVEKQSAANNLTLQGLTAGIGASF